jgi:hypothetical protein
LIALQQFAVAQAIYFLFEICAFININSCWPLTVSKKNYLKSKSLVDCIINHTFIVSIYIKNFHLCVLIDLHSC